MQRVDHVFRVVLHHVGIGQDRDPIVLAALGRLDSVHAEAAGETRYTAEDGLEGFAQVMGNEVPATRVSICNSHDIPIAFSTYSKTWIMDTHEARLLAILVSPQRPMISGSLTMAEIMCDMLSGKILVSASTMSTTS